MSGFAINQLTISANLTRDPELRNLPSGQAVTQLRIAHNASRKNSNGDWVDVPAYFDVSVWGAMGEWVARSLAKGDQVVIAGRLRWREYEVDGKPRQAVDITADSVIPVTRNGPASATNQTPDSDPVTGDPVAA